MSVRSWRLYETGVLAETPTRLKRLDTRHQERLINWGYAVCDAAIRKSTDEYEKATKAMNEAAKETKEAIDSLAKLDQAIGKVANAIGKVTGLLAKVG